MYVSQRYSYSQFCKLLFLRKQFKDTLAIVKSYCLYPFHHVEILYQIPFPKVLFSCLLTFSDGTKLIASNMDNFIIIRRLKRITTTHLLFVSRLEIPIFIAHSS